MSHAPYLAERTTVRGQLTDTTRDQTTGDDRDVDNVPTEYVGRHRRGTTEWG